MLAFSSFQRLAIPLSTRLKLFEHKPFDARAVMRFGILNGISIGLLNLSLGFKSVGLYQKVNPPSPFRIIKGGIHKHQDSQMANGNKYVSFEYKSGMDNGRNASSSDYESQLKGHNNIIQLIDHEVPPSTHSHMFTSDMLKRCSYRVAFQGWQSMSLRKFMLLSELIQLQRRLKRSLPKQHKRFNLKKLTYEERKAKLIERLHTLNAAAGADSEKED
ncbi:hypothetical protein J1N35_022609 [Gossypium stocksii]|uniref:Large ribosomal subunit protein uL18 C-terminal eukaryotes domain-containing protein n=1 Tax=Gossypium stocksii TaxID=47602 RepID=A0A9D3VH32_9ROSI|nr:hypothetical protein J1N35_022609 [Gossypium stocksii]